MSGLFLLLVIVGWGAVAFYLIRWITRPIKAHGVRLFVALLLFPLLMLLPLVDEIIAQPRFEALCKENAVLVIDAEAVKGKNVRLTFEPSNAQVPGIAVPVLYTRDIFRDAVTGQTYGSSGSYVAEGGWLIRSLMISESNSPLWMSPRSCSLNESAAYIAQRLGFQLVN